MELQKTTICVLIRPSKELIGAEFFDKFFRQSLIIPNRFPLTENPGDISKATSNGHGLFLKVNVQCVHGEAHADS